MNKTIFFNKRTNDYSNKVLIGNWIYSRLEEESIEEIKNEKVSTVYNESFTFKPTKRDEFSTTNLRMDFETSRLFDNLGRYDIVNNPFENFSTLYDLSFNHFPKCYKTTLLRQRRGVRGCFPKDEYLPSFGNVTEHGLLKSKREEWTCELEKPVSVYRTQFQVPEATNYHHKRFFRQSYKKHEKDAIDRFFIELEARKKGTPVKQPLTPVGREKYCNPITWECS